MTELRTSGIDPAHELVDLAVDGRPDLTACDREPIHLSGAIQPHGVLLAVRADDLSVQRVSANTADHLGAGPMELLGAPLARALGEVPAARLREALANPRSSGADPQVLHPFGSTAPYEMTWHRVDGLILLELEPADDGTSSSVATLFADIRHAMELLQSASDPQALCDSAAAEIKYLTGYDRVMLYRFHPDWHGEIVSEQREPELEPFLGLHYPAADIPRQARKLYLLNHLRVIADTTYQPAPILGAPDLDDRPLDLSLSGLRSVSPVHLAYLRNMGVSATLTVSLMQGTRLWGMVACHHRSPKRLDAQRRAACRVLGQVFSVQIVTAENQEREAYRARLARAESQLTARMAATDTLASALAPPVYGTELSRAEPGDPTDPADPADPRPLALTLTDADGLVGRIDGETVTLGVVPPPAAVRLLLDRLCAAEEPAALICDDLAHRFAELGPFAADAAGVIAWPLSPGYRDFILWFRGERVHEVRWAGNPDQHPGGEDGAPPPAAGGPGLSPRASFAAWAQEVHGRSRPWSPAEVDTARSLAAAIPDLQLARARDHMAQLAHVAERAMYDPLTALPNRALLLERTAAALRRQARGGPQVALLFIDLDRFKLVNDSLGHAAGDNVLLEAAQRLSVSVRDADTVARIGGDEFIVLSEGSAPAQATRLAERILDAFRAPFLIDGRQARVTASIGVAVADADTTPADLLRDADTAMYRAKHSGRNSTASFTPQMRARTARRVEIETSLSPALERGELQLHFQPIFRAAGPLTGFEALARWPLAGRGMIPPDEFIPVAEATGLIGPLTEWALDQGLRMLAQWRRTDPELTLAVNIVTGQMTIDELPDTVDAALRRHHLPPQALCLEFTESALVTDAAVGFLHQMRDRGVRLSIDDFGTGYSSLAYLTKLPVHELKIDRAFVAGIPTSGTDVTVVKSVVALAHQLGLQALAEGVETPEQLATVRELGCDLVQGYLLGRPMPADDIDRLLTQVPPLEG